MKLKQCPFCGSKVFLSGSDRVGKDQTPFWYVVCFECGSSAKGHRDKQTAEEQWNRRAYDETEKARSVKSATWVEDSSGKWHCSNCGEVNLYAYSYGDGEYTLQDLYCPHCGAKMEVQK